MPDGKANILIVDDRPENLIALEAILSDPAYNLVRATSGSQALGHLLRHEFAAILLDVHMPELNGFDTAVMIRQREKTREVPIIFLSATYKTDEFVRKGIESGGMDYIAKPFDPTVLRAKVATLVKLFKQHRNTRELLERARVENENRFRHLVDNLDQAIAWTADAKTLRFLFVSKSAEGILGYPIEEWMRDSRFLDRHSHPEDIETLLNAFRATLNSGLPQKCEHRMISAKDEETWFKTALHLEPGLSAGPQLRGVCLDITSLKETQRDLKKAIGLREDVLAIVSHDLKNPLSAISMNVAAIKRHLPPEDPGARVPRTLDLIEKATARMIRMISDLLDLAKIHEGRLVLSAEPLEAKKLAEEAMELMLPIARAKKIRLESRNLPEHCELECDHDRVLQVLSNLLGNALKFTRGDGLVTISVQDLGESAQFEVTDTGTGIPEKDLPHIFERYWQAEAAKKKGAGLGLYIAKGIVEAHHGKIWAESQPGSGARFRFTLPKRRPNEAAA